MLSVWQDGLTAESVQGASLPLQGIDHIHGGDSLPLGVFGVGDGIPDHILQEDLEDTTGLLVDQARDTLDSSPPRQTPDGGLGDALDVIPQHLPVALGASLAESLSSFATSSHDASVSETDASTANWSGLYRPDRQQGTLSWHCVPHWLELQPGPSPTVDDTGEGTKCSQSQ